MDLIRNGTFQQMFLLHCANILGIIWSPNLSDGAQKMYIQITKLFL